MNKVSLTGEDKFMPELHLKQSGFTYRRFTYSACGPFTNRKEFKNLEKQVI